MLRITHSKNAAGAAKYFDEGLQRADYFAAEEQAIGTWGGKAAERLGLSGEVQKEEFIALCHNQKPDGSRLNPRHSNDRKVGYDFTFSVPKSVSVAYAITGNEKIRMAFEQSVEATMQELETNMRTQSGQGKDKKHVTTGEMIWASFTHRTSRPVDGLPDPHLTDIVLPLTLPGMNLPDVSKRENLVPLNNPLRITRPRLMRGWQ